MKQLTLLSLTLIALTTFGCSKSVDLNSGGSSNLSGINGGVGGASGAGGGGTTGTGGTGGATGGSGSCNSAQSLIANTCVCPGAGHFDGKSCVSCGPNQAWNSTSNTCVNQCSVGEFLNPAGQCVTCQTNQAWDGVQCVSNIGNSGLAPVVCNSYEELKSPFIVPARDCMGTCYYVKLSSTVPLQNSSDFTLHDTNVWSRNHDSGGQAPSHPYIIGSSATNAGAAADIQFMMEGTRQVTLAGDQGGMKDIYVDNYVLLQILQGGQTTYFAEGSADSPTYQNSSVANDTGFVNVGGTDLKNFQVGAAGGTSNFNPIDFGNELQTNTVIDFKSEALDCGVVGQVSDIYLLFR
jgi:hypothetical protein